MNHVFFNARPCVVPLAIDLSSFPALADPISGLSCGIYNELRSQIRVLNHALLQQSFPTETTLHHYRLEGSKLKRVTLEELVDTTYEIDTAQLKQLCEDHIDSACSRWKARTSAEKSGQSLFATVTGIPAAPVQAYIDTMAALCRSGVSATLCTEAAKA